MALVPGTWSDATIRLLAERAAGSGDARRVIEFLSSAAERCEFRQDGHTEQVITVEDIHAMSDTVRSIHKRASRWLTTFPHKACSFVGHVPSIADRGDHDHGDVERLYAVVCEEYDQKPKATRRFGNTPSKSKKRRDQYSSGYRSRWTGRTTHLSMRISFQPTSQVGLNCFSLSDFAAPERTVGDDGAKYGS